MPSSQRDFFFRYRRLFLIGLFIVGFVLGPFLRQPLALRLADFLALHAAGGREFWTHVTEASAAVLLGLAAFWRTWGSAYLGTNVVQDKELHTERLVADGPYRLSRNPLYLGNMFLVLGLGLLVNARAAAVFIVGMWILVRLFICDEEAGMVESKGEPYRAYREAVPRLFPAFRPRIPAAGARPRWAQGFCGESVLWAMTVSTAWLAVTLDHERYGQVLLMSVIIAVPLFFWARWHTKRQAAAASQ
jgi:protein-S-isoprenylcysteine O-methyltransferase Ste14